jgi:PadR family transcriptional regulator, regulatory protein PadR
MSTPDTPPGALPKNFLRPCLLLLLREHPAHGYDLLERLRPLGFTRDDPGRLYRALRGLESEGLVHSAWEASASGPDRRIYELTRTGMEALHEAVQSLLTTNAVVGVFLSRYAEFVALERRGTASDRR